MHPVHPMLVHFPIALLSASVFCDLLALRWRQQDCRLVGLYTLFFGLVGALLSVASGALAEEAVEHSGVPEYWRFTRSWVLPHSGRSPPCWAGGLRSGWDGLGSVGCSHWGLVSWVWSSWSSPATTEEVSSMTMVRE